MALPYETPQRTPVGVWAMPAIIQWSNPQQCHGQPVRGLSLIERMALSYKTQQRTPVGVGHARDHPMVQPATMPWPTRARFKPYRAHGALLQDQQRTPVGEGHARDHPMVQHATAMASPCVV